MPGKQRTTLRVSLHVVSCFIFNHHQLVSALALCSYVYKSWPKHSDGINTTFSPAICQLKTLMPGKQRTTLRVSLHVVSCFIFNHHQLVSALALCSYVYKSWPKHSDGINTTFSPAICQLASRWLSCSTVVSH
uniref:Secreted protein n=1 Tax=Ixodes ricinus TaxID=34613 RepID=A0A6B0URT8_IXORI